VILDAFRLTDPVAIVTGAGVGIGREIAVAFAEAGADVVVAARTRADLDDTVALIEQTGRRGMAVVTDVMRGSAHRVTSLPLQCISRHPPRRG
jgi:7-alpha-hydroxysteroid dehydrogenase